MGRPRRELTEKEKAACGKNEFIDPQGYIRIRRPGAPGGNVMKHRVTMEAVIGRPLNKNERVKFLDGDRLNCNADNLYISVVGTVDPNRVVAKLHTEKRRLLERVEEIDKELALMNGEATLDKPWES